MIWIGLIIGFVVSTPLGYLLGRRAKKTKSKSAKPKPVTFDEMMAQAWKAPKNDPELAAEVDADIENRFRDL